MWHKADRSELTWVSSIIDCIPMEPKFFQTMSTAVYISLWSKYRPAIVQLMLASENGPQQYKLFDHEFKALNSKEKTYSFELQAYRGRAVNNIKTSVPAQDLLNMLNTSRKASELIGEGQFDFKLDKQFVLHISRKKVEAAV
jgi:hypothetical protein